jgi:hypothetical protein
MRWSAAATGALARAWRIDLAELALIERLQIGERKSMLTSRHHLSAGLGIVVLVMLGARSADSQPPASDSPAHDTIATKTEMFDGDPGWIGVNNRAARMQDPVMIRQNFGFSPRTSNAGGSSPGEIGGFVSAAAEVAFYGKVIEPTTLDKPLTASGTMSIGKGSTHLLLGFFNATTVNEWRTPNTMALRLNGRGDHFFAYVEYCTSKWRAGADTTPFPAVIDPSTGRWNLIGFPCQKSYKWTLTYDPSGNGGKGVITATIGEATAECKLEQSHRSDGASFNHFGIINVMKSADSGSEVWFDDISLSGRPPEAFDKDPRWDGRNNRALMPSRIVRPWFDFGYTNTNYAGGSGKGELGGRIFRGDCREVHRMACYGDRVGPLTLGKPLKASGKIAMTRGVSDSTTLFGFYHSAESMRQNESQSNGIPKSVLGIHIEGPSSEGFKFYPVMRGKGGGSAYGQIRESPTIYPDGNSHDWSLEYRPDADGKSRIIVTLDDETGTLELQDDLNVDATTFDRFGIVTSWIDGNSQDVYWDDLTYTARQE